MGVFDRMKAKAKVVVNVSPSSNASTTKDSQGIEDTAGGDIAKLKVS